MYCNVSDANRRAMAFTHLRAAFTFYASFAARFPIPPPPRHIFSVLSLLLLLSFSLAFSRMLLVHPNPHLAFSPNISLSLSLADTDIATEVGHEETGAVCHSSLSSPISRQFHVVHKLSSSRARRTKVAVLARHRRRRRRPCGKG